MLQRSPVRVEATVTESKHQNQIPKDMVFSNTPLRTHSILKVVEIDRLKEEKVDDLPSEITEGTSLTEFQEFLKTEPVFESKMLQESDCEFFQDLGLWCSPDKEDQIKTIDVPANTQERALNTTTLNTQFSPQGWDGLDANSPLAHSSFYTSTPRDALSPETNLFPFELSGGHEQFLDIGALPVVIGELASEDTKPLLQQSWIDTNTYTDTHKKPFIQQEDSLGYDTKSTTFNYMWTGDTSANEEILSEFMIDGANNIIPAVSPHKLKLNVTARAPSLEDAVISTPEVLHYVEQLEKEKLCRPFYDKEPLEGPQLDVITSIPLGSASTNTTASHLEYDPVTPKTESHFESDFEDNKSVTSSRKRRRNSEDSDETYTPYAEKPTQRKYRRRKNVPLEDMIEMLEGSQQQNKARRGRPPKRRESAVSSICSDNASTHEIKYRELRDKNNAASKRSRMNRKLKELQMERKANDLEERNQKLRVRAELLEDMTKKLKAALMAAIINK